MYSISLSTNLGNLVQMLL